MENQAYVDMDEAHIGTEAENGEKKDEHTRNYVPAKYVLDADGRDINGENVAAGDIVTYKITYKNDGYTVRTVEVEFHHIGASAARDGHSCFLRMCMIHKVMY